MLCSHIVSASNSRSFRLLSCHAEDGIRYSSVTGVQTCALPIWCVVEYWFVCAFALDGICVCVYVCVYMCMCVCVCVYQTSRDNCTMDTYAVILEIPAGGALTLPATFQTHSLFRSLPPPSHFSSLSLSLSL